MKARPFSLVKWYMDCVTDEGSVAILYCADLHWHGVHAQLSSVLSGNKQPAVTRTSISRHQISNDGGRISAALPKLDVSGVWEADAAPFERTVYERDTGCVRWNCLQPRSRAHVRIGDRELSGAGYAECLTITIPPWRLPLRRLRWGRFVSPQDCLTWIDWHGAYNTCFAIYNGNERMPLAVSDSEVVVDDARLEIEAGVALRSGKLGTTILPGAPGLGKLLPFSIFNVDERKWLSRGSMTTKDGTSTGWVIHEVVRWEV